MKSVFNLLYPLINGYTNNYHQEYDEEKDIYTKIFALLCHQYFEIDLLQYNQIMRIITFNSKFINN